MNILITVVIQVPPNAPWAVIALAITQIVPFTREIRLWNCNRKRISALSDRVKQQKNKKRP